MRYINLKDPRHSYFFGFIQADGTLRAFPRNRGYLEIELAERDKEILKIFKKLFSSIASPIHKRVRDINFKKRYASYILRIFKKEFREELTKLGFVPGKKFLYISPPKCEFRERDYIRGLIDADGSVGIAKEGYPFISISVKSEELKAYLCEVIERITGERKNIMRNKRDDVYNIMLVREKAQQFIRYLYYPGCLALKRKIRKAEKAMKWKRPKNLKRIIKRKFWEPREDEYILTHPLKESCAKLKRSEGSIKMRIWRLKNNKARYLKIFLTYH